MQMNKYLVDGAIEGSVCGRAILRLDSHLHLPSLLLLLLL